MEPHLSHTEGGGGADKGPVRMGGPQKHKKKTGGGEGVVHRVSLMKPIFTYSPF